MQHHIAFRIECFRARTMKALAQLLILTAARDGQGKQNQYYWKAARQLMLKAKTHSRRAHNVRYVTKAYRRVECSAIVGRSHDDAADVTGNKLFFTRNM